MSLGRGLNFGTLAFASVPGCVVVGIPGGDAILLNGVSIDQLNFADFFM